MGDIDLLSCRPLKHFNSYSPHLIVPNFWLLFHLLFFKKKEKILKIPNSILNSEESNIHFPRELFQSKLI